MVEIVCRAAVDAVRGHGGMTALWIDEARRAASTALDEMSSEHGDGGRVAVDRPPPR